MASELSFIELPTGARMPTVGLGTWRAEDAVTAAVDVALDCGYKLIDTAFNYGTEAAIGKALKSKFEKGHLNREDVFITSKLWPGHMSSRQEVLRACKMSLERLQLDYLDLYLIHHPWGIKFIDDHQMFPKDENGKLMTANYDLEQVWKAMEELVDAGLTKAIGVSNFNSNQIQRMCKIARHPVSNVQVECHAYLQQKSLQEFCKQRKTSITAYGPIGSPNRPHEYGPCINPEAPRLLDDPLIKSLAEKYKRTTAQILLRNLIQRGIAVIPKSSNPDRIQENIQVFDFELSTEDMEKIANIDKGIRFFNATMVSNHPEFPYNEPF